MPTYNQTKGRTDGGRRGKMFHNPFTDVKKFIKQNEQKNFKLDTRINNNNNLLQYLNDIIPKVFKNIIHLMYLLKNDKNNSEYKSILKAHYDFVYQNMFQYLWKIYTDDIESNIIKNLQKHSVIDPPQVLGGGLRNYLTVNKYIVNLRYTYYNNIKNIEVVDNMIKNINDIHILYQVCEYHIGKILMLFDQDKYLIKIEKGKLMVGDHCKVWYSDVCLYMYLSTKLIKQFIDVLGIIQTEVDTKNPMNYPLEKQIRHNCVPKHSELKIPYSIKKNKVIIHLGGKQKRVYMR